jgi:hypothetical protein
MDLTLDLTFGARLRSQRERRHVSLSAIAAETKINTALLEALERDDVSRWPYGVFRRAYFRSYVRAIGLESEPLLKEFLELYPDPTAEHADEQSSVASNAEGAANRQPATRIGRALAAMASWRRTRQPITDSTADPSAPASVLPLASRLDAFPVASALRADHGSSAESPRVETNPIPELRIQMVAPASQLAPLAIELVTPMHGQGSTPPRAVASDGHRGRPRAEQTLPLPELPAVAADQNEGRLPPRQRTTRRPVARTALHRDRHSLLRTVASIAHLCTTLGCARTQTQVADVLRELSTIVGASAVVLWVWDAVAQTLYPIVICGYAGEAARIPAVDPKADNAIAAAFNSAQFCVVKGAHGSSGAVAAPLLTTAGCAGVLALEFENSGEQRRDIQSLISILSAQLATLMRTLPIGGTVKARRLAAGGSRRFSLVAATESISRTS